MGTPCAGANLDVVFVLDGSGSMTLQGFTITKEFLASMAESLTIGDNATQVGIVQFSDRFSLDIRLNQYTHSASNLAAAIRAVPWHNAGTYVGEAIDFTLNTAFTAGTGDRLCSPDVLVVITDGKDRGAMGIPGPVSMAGCRNILTIGVGVGDSVSDAELLEIAAGDPTRRFKVTSVADLRSIQRKLCSAIKGKAESPCVDAPCAYGSTCYPTQDFQDFVCVCPPGYTGNLCQYDINECETGPCVHGDCYDAVNHYNCTCDDNYKGINCQFEKCVLCPFPCWLVFLLLALLLLAIAGLIYVYCCCRKRSKVVEYVPVAVVKPASMHRQMQTEPLPPPTPIVIEIPTPALTPLPSYILPRVDLLFMVDNSGSVGLSDYKLVRAFLHKFLDHLHLTGHEEEEVPADPSRFGVLVFNREPKVIIPLTSEYSKDDARKMENLPHEGHGTRLGAALLKALDIFKPELRKKYAGVPKVLIIISDGFSEDEVEKGAITLRTLGVIIAVVGVRKINVPTFLTLTQSRDLIFQVTSFDDLKLWLRRRMVEELTTAIENRKFPSKGKKRRAKSAFGVGRRSSVAPSSQSPTDSVDTLESIHHDAPDTLDLLSCSDH